MNRKMIYVEPSILGYKLDLMPGCIDYSDKEGLKLFIHELHQLINIITDYSLKLIVSQKIAGDISSSVPILPFDKSKIEDGRLKTLANTVERLLPRIMTRANLYKAKCSISEDKLEETLKKNEYYFDFVETLLNCCDHVEGDVWEFIIKSKESNFFDGAEYEVECDNSCMGANKISNKYVCYSVDEFQNVIFQKTIENYTGFESESELNELVKAHFAVNPALNTCCDALVQPLEISYTSRFKKDLERYSDLHIKKALLESLTKKVYDIKDKGLGDEEFKGHRRFRVTDYWRVNYKVGRDRIQLFEFGPHDIGIKK